MTSDADEFAYGGGELVFFQHAVRWKAYYSRLIQGFLGRRVLEVGAGIGATTPALIAGRNHEEWVCLEPDSRMASRISAEISSGRLPEFCRSECATVRDFPLGPGFDSILYIDVLEHIEDDRGEVEAALERLAPGGHLVVLAPAHGWLFSEFDRQIGHFRRYTRRSLSALFPPSAEPVVLSYLDSAGLIASLGNRLLLRQSLPTHAQIRLWDSRLVPVSASFLDRILFYRCGKSVLGIWRKGA